jgi:hypothetical protein
LTKYSFFDKIDGEDGENMSIDPTWTRLEWAAVQNQASVDQNAEEAQREQNKREEEARKPS